MVSKNQELPNTTERGQAKGTVTPKRNYCNVYLGMGVCPQHQKKVKHCCQVFTWISKTRMTQEITLFLCITACSLFLFY